MQILSLSLPGACPFPERIRMCILFLLSIVSVGEALVPEDSWLRDLGIIIIIIFL